MKIINEIPKDIPSGTLVALDVETFGQEKGHLHRPTGSFACLSISIEGRVGVYQIYDSRDIRAVLRNLQDCTWVFHNGLYDLRQLRRYAKIDPRFIWDTMLVDQSMYGGYYQTFGLQDLVRRWLNERMIKDTRAEFSAATTMTAEMKKYAAKDALYTLRIAKLQKAEFEDDPGFRAYTMVDEPMIFPLLDMPGVEVDVKGWKEMVAFFEAEAHRIEDELDINTFSGPQVIKAAGKHGIHIRDTKAETLKAYKDVDFISKVIEARMYRKAVSTYGEKWLTNNVEEDGKVYSSYHITGAETGRMSSSNPNMQQIPARKMPQYRKLFPASSGHVMLISDVNQQEPRILAYESRDAELIKIFERGEDSHLAVARAIFNEPNMKSDDPRRKNEGKTINLGMSYGLSEYGAALRLGITEQEAAVLIRQYFTKFRDVLLWIGQKRIEAQSKGFVTTVSGRRVYINPYDRQWQNACINAPIQGGAADFTKMWVRRIWEICRKLKVAFLVSLIVHDEVGQNVPKGQVKIYKELTQKAFDDTAAKLFKPIPFAVDMAMGKSWAAKQMESEVEDDEEME